MKYLRFYLDRDCVIVPGWGKTKRVRSGCGSWTLADTQRNPDMLKKNAKVLNGTGGLLIVDVDPKNGGSVEALHRRFPDLPDTRTVQTVTPHPDGLGTHLIFTIPDDVRVAGRQLGTGIDIPYAVMLPGSVVRCDDGVERTYELVNEMEPAPAPLSLIAAVDRGQDSGVSTSVYEIEDGADGTVDSLVAKFAAAGPGERNDTFLEVAPAVIRLRGSDGADMLRAVYTGDNDKWLESALKSAMQKYIGTAAPSSIIPSRYVTQALEQIAHEARYGRWVGAGRAADRKVLLAVLEMCETRRRMTALASIRELALLTGLEPKTVNSALARLVESGRLCIVGSSDDGASAYTPIVGELTTGVSKEESPLRGSSVDPLHAVWLSDGLTGRHSHVFDLVSVGVRRAKQIATAGGMAYDTARDALAKLVNAGMLDRQGATYSVPADVVEVADRLAVELGGVDRRATLAARIRDERARPRGDATPVVADDPHDDDLRRWHEEELMRQLGMI
jgi:hypothetical protein